MPIANENRPLKFKDYVGQEGNVNYITSIIKSNKHPNGIVISGMPGTGKTTLAHLYVYGTLCHNRKEGEFEPCGVCDSCTSKNHPNITEYRVTEASAFKDIVGDLISITKTAPVVLQDEPRDDQLHKFIVIDEVQNASRASIGPFLDSLEFSHSKVTIILISMDLSKMDPIVRDAVESRCVELSLDTLSEEQVASNIQSYINIDEKAAKLIAYLSKGNMRKAWGLVDFFLAQMPAEEVTSEIVYKQKFGGLSNTVFDSLLDSIQNDTWDNTRKIVRKFGAAETMAVDMFIRRLTALDLNVNGIKLVSALSTWYQCMYKAPLDAVVLPFQGRILLQQHEEKESATIKTEVNTVKQVMSSKQELDSMKQSLTSQLTAIAGKKVKEDKQYPFLTFTSWRQLIDYYVVPNADPI